eukprot:scaffold22726_cov90-Skeletonema_dohrnii-CCMP3373.AAC.1
MTSSLDVPPTSNGVGSAKVQSSSFRKRLFCCCVPFSVVLVSEKHHVFSSTTWQRSGRHIDLAHRSEKDTSNSLVRRTKIYLNN